MAQYRYRALDHQGNAVDGTIDETSARRVTLKLQERGLTVTSVEPVHRELHMLRRSGALTWQELEIVTQALAALVRSNLPLAPALKTMAADIERPRLRRVLQNMHRELDRGQSLEEAIAKEPAFPHVYHTLIRAGESAGNLPGVLQMLCGHATRQVETRNALSAAIYYPLIVSCVAVFILLFLTIKVIPVFVEIFDDFGGNLPAPTKFWIGVSDSVAAHYKAYFLAIIAGAVFLFLFGTWIRRGESRRVQWDRFYMWLPVLGHQRYIIALSRFARTLAMLLYARVPVLESLELAAAASGSPFLARAVSEASLRVAGGERLADAFASTHFFGHHFCWLVATGEDRGQVEETLRNAADYLDREATLRDRTTLALATPAAVIVLALFVGSIIISMYLPIFTLGDQINQ